MAFCANVDTTNAVIVNTTPPDQCTGLILLSVSDWQSQQSPLWQLTPAQGAEIAGAMLLPLAMAWVIRMIARFLTSSDGESQNV